MVAHRKAGPNIRARRVAGEVAEKVVATRLTATEHKAFEGLAQARGVSPGLLVRAWVQSAIGGVLQVAQGAQAAPPTIDELVDRLVMEEAEAELKRICDVALDGLDVVRRRRKHDGRHAADLPRAKCEECNGTGVVETEEECVACCRALQVTCPACARRSAAATVPLAPPAAPPPAPKPAAAPGLSWEDVKALAARLNFVPHEGAQSPAAVFGCVRKLREAIDTGNLGPRPWRRWYLHELCHTAGTRAADLAILYLFDTGELARVDGDTNRPGSSNESLTSADPTSVPCPKRGCPADRAGKACFDSRGMALPKGRVHKERAALAARQLRLTRG